MQGKLLDLDEGRTLVRLARKAIESRLKGGEVPEPPKEQAVSLKIERGVFVTLEKEGRLRGCIGRPRPDKLLPECVMNSAVDSAVNDSRFRPLDREELDEVTIEVSIMTPPEELEVDDLRKRKEKVKVGRDGLIVNMGPLGGLLLPQVPVDQGWDAEEFLSQACMKAGLTPDSWLRDDVRIEKFSAQVFKEEKPGGEVRERSLSR